MRGSPARTPVAPLLVPPQGAPVSKTQGAAGAREGALFGVHSLVLLEVGCQCINGISVEYVQCHDADI